MELRALSATGVVKLVLERTGVPFSDPLSVENLAFSLRRAASLICPVSPRGLVSAVVDVLEPIVSEDRLRERCNEVLEELICHGDLIELEDVTRLSGNRLLYRAPPSFVRISEATWLVIGIAPDGINPIPVNLSPKYKGVLRIVDNNCHPAIEQVLRHAGLHELPYAAWARAPATKHYSEVLAKYDRALRQASRSGSVDGLQVLNTAIHNSSYRKQWVNPQGLTGTFVARRPRQYGADLWCYVELLDGEPQRLADLPLGRTVERPCDQAWRLQCAVDADRGTPQKYRIKGHGENVLLRIHLPCPAWLLRRWECIGQRKQNSVFIFEFARAVVSEEADLLEKELWMAQEK